MKTRSWLNKRAIENSESNPDNIPARLKDGRVRWLPFGGFIDKRRVETMPNPQYLKLSVFALIDDRNQWIDIPEDDYLVGIYYVGKAWVVLDGATCLQRRWRQD